MAKARTIREFLNGAVIVPDEYEEAEIKHVNVKNYKDKCVIEITAVNRNVPKFIDTEVNVTFVSD